MTERYVAPIKTDSAHPNHPRYAFYEGRYQFVATSQEGWYADPYDDNWGSQRWWDGSAWSKDRTRVRPDFEPRRLPVPRG
ncbi:MAG: DUF2510 domain-containing protein [Solirubrobacteraceae bacterium]|nr:DUF2510 domain-containing protein [Solirubrobacteraceae bacterium]